MNDVEEMLFSRVKTHGRGNGFGATVEIMPDGKMKVLRCDKHMSDCEGREITYRRRPTDSRREKRDARRMADMAKDLKRIKAKERNENS